MSADADLVKKYLHRLRHQFYPDDEKGFFQQRTMLITALTTPARWLDERGVRLPVGRLDEILDDIVKTIMRHGDTARIGYFCRYFLHAIQQHMSHQGERYYEEGKSLRFITETALENLSSKQRAKLSEAQDPTTERLAELNRLLRQTSVKKRKASQPTATQPDLFG